MDIAKLIDPAGLHAEMHALLTAAASNVDLFDADTCQSLEDVAQRIDDIRALSIESLIPCDVAIQRLDENHIKWRENINAV